MGKDNYKPKVNSTAATYSVLLGATKSQKAAAKRHIAANSGYGVPEMFKEFGQRVVESTPRKLSDNKPI